MSGVFGHSLQFWADILGRKWSLVKYAAIFLILGHFYIRVLIQPRSRKTVEKITHFDCHKKKFSAKKWCRALRFRPWASTYGKSMIIGGVTGILLHAFNSKHGTSGLFESFETRSLFAKRFGQTGPFGLLPIPRLLCCPVKNFIFC